MDYTSEKFNGHLEVIKDNGLAAKTIDEYADGLRRLREDKEYFEKCTIKSKDIFEEKYNLKNQMILMQAILEDAVNNPFPHGAIRVLLHFKSYVYCLLKRIYIGAIKKNKGDSDV